MSLDNAQEELSTKAASTGFQLVWGVISKLSKKGWDRATLTHVMRRYAEQYVLRHGSIKVLGMNSPIPLLTIYTAVKVVPPWRDAYRDLDGLKDSLKNRELAYTPNGKGEPGMLVANRECRLNVLGAPGAGKSTFLKRVGLEALLPRTGWENSSNIAGCSTPVVGDYTPECFPVYIELRRFKHEPIDIHRALVQEFDACGLPEANAFITICLSEGRLLLLFDGVDEVPTDKLDSVIQHVTDFADKHTNNRFITSCRTAFYKTFFRKFVDVELTAFDDRQIERFVSGWFGSNLDRENRSAETFISLLFSKEHRATLELARTPLLLTFLCLVYDASQKFPVNRSSLYRRALMILMERWAAEKRVHNSPISAELHTELEMELLSEIAAKAYAKDQILFSQKELVDQITNFMRETLNAPRTLDAKRLLEAIEVQQGLFVERAADAYSFSHLTVQEYLTAEYFHTPGKTAQLVEEYLFDQKWREVFLLSAGMPGADELLFSMLKECDLFIAEMPRVLRCVQWVGKIVPVTGRVLEDAVLRIFILSLPLRFKRLEFHQERVESLADDLITALNPDFFRTGKVPTKWGIKSAQKWLQYIGPSLSLPCTVETIIENLRRLSPSRPLDQMAPGSRHAFKREVSKVVYQGFGLDEDLQNLSRVRAIELQTLFYGYKLIVDCKNAALRLSSAKWEEACKRIGTIDPIALRGQKRERPRKFMSTARKHPNSWAATLRQASTKPVREQWSQISEGS